MAHKKNHSAPVPPGNRPSGGPPGADDTLPADEAAQKEGSPGHEQDPKRRLGNFEGAGEHSIQQPGGKNDSNH